MVQAARAPAGWQIMAENGNQKPELTPRQKRAIAALLTESDAKAAAAAAGVGYRTLCRWLTFERFRLALTQAEGAALDGATRRLLVGQSRALDALEGLIKSSKSETVQRQAAVNWLDTLLKLLELRNIEQRVTAIEEFVYGTKR
jgi:hypothetical protein